MKNRITDSCGVCGSVFMVTGEFMNEIEKTHKEFCEAHKKCRDKIGIHNNPKLEAK